MWPFTSSTSPAADQRDSYPGSDVNGPVIPSNNADTDTTCDVSLLHAAERGQVRAIYDYLPRSIRVPIPFFMRPPDWAQLDHVTTDEDGVAEDLGQGLKAPPTALSNTRRRVRQNQMGFESDRSVRRRIDATLDDGRPASGTCAGLNARTRNSKVDTLSFGVAATRSEHNNGGEAHIESATYSRNRLETMW